MSYPLSATIHSSPSLMTSGMAAPWSTSSRRTPPVAPALLPALPPTPCIPITAHCPSPPPPSGAGMPPSPSLLPCHLPSPHCVLLPSCLPPCTDAFQICKKCDMPLPPAPYTVNIHKITVACLLSLQIAAQESSTMSSKLGPAAALH